jgi:hypothetical protein
VSCLALQLYYLQLTAPAIAVVMLDTTCCLRSMHWSHVASMSPWVEITNNWQMSLVRRS